jgi:hypothetical protein
MRNVDSKIIARLDSIIAMIACELLLADCCNRIGA